MTSSRLILLLATVAPGCDYATPTLVGVTIPSDFPEREDLERQVRDALPTFAECIAFRPVQLGPNRKPPSNEAQVDVVLDVPRAPDGTLSPPPHVAVAATLSEPDCIGAEVDQWKLSPRALARLGEADPREPMVSFSYRYRPSAAKREAVLEQKTWALKRLSRVFADEAREENVNKDPLDIYRGVRDSLPKSIRNELDVATAAIRAVGPRPVARWEVFTTGVIFDAWAELGTPISTFGPRAEAAHDAALRDGLTEERAYTRGLFVALRQTLEEASR